MASKNRITFYATIIITSLFAAACSKDGGESALQSGSREESQAMVILRGLPTLNTNHSVAIVELDPEAENFGEILHEYEITNMDLPLHHLYYSPTGRLYSTGMDPKCSLAEIQLARDASGVPVINGIECIDTQGQVVGEDIMWHSVNGKEYMFVTFMGGTGLDQADGGSVGVFDADL